MQITRLTKDQALRLGDFPKRDRKEGTWDKYNAKKGAARTVGAIFVDGEGCTIEKGLFCGQHGYIYLAACDADGDYLYEKFDEEGISTQDCFWFLVNLPVNYRKVAFSFNYDINMMLRDIPEHELRILRKNGFVRWKGWTINWTERKMFSVKRKVHGPGGKVTKSCTVWDIFGYFQKSFVKTIWSWQVGTEQELRTVAAMKERRDRFTIAEIAEISSYCRLECKLGAEIFDKLIDSTKSVGLTLKRYDGAGSVAAAMLKKYSIESYMHQTTNRIPDEIIKSGYYGGRFDLTTFGECGDAIQLDINSAYPYQAVSLPCLSCGTWEYSAHYDGAADWAIWNTSWNIDKSVLWSPFPYRNSKGHIHYLRNGQGWYWANEVREACNLYPTAIHPREGYIFHVGCDHQPFRFIIDYFDKRRKLKLAGDLAEMILKLGLNSLYGKLAQGVGRFRKDGVPRPPQTQCLIWAGLITSNTRAMLLEAIRGSTDDAILFATDAVISKSQNSALKIGDGLGEWKPEYLQQLFIISNGFYQARGVKEVKFATRGFGSRDLYDADNNIDHWKRIRELARRSNNFVYDIPVTNFITLGTALDSNPVLNNWRQWIDDTRRINYGRFDRKEVRDGRLFPGNNPWGLEPSQPFEPKLYRQDDAPLLDAYEAGLIECEEEDQLAANATRFPVD